MMQELVIKEKCYNDVLNLATQQRDRSTVFFFSGFFVVCLFTYLSCAWKHLYCFLSFDFFLIPF